MVKKDPPDDFLADYKQWVDHRHNPYFWAGTISNFSLRAWRNRRRFRKRDGVASLVIGAFFLALVALLIWGICVENGDWTALPVLLLLAVFGVLATLRGLRTILGKPPNIEIDD
jgi:peptidoglycan/LPS O-acetylase OafA/YrhL